MQHYLIFLFFFQAEDGIRDRTVTGVQTCALPIWKTDQSGKNLGWSGGRRTSATAAAASCQQQAGHGRTRQSTKPLVGLHELPPWAQSAAGTTPPEKRTRTADIVLTA